MSDKSDMTLNEPLASGWLRAEFAGDEDTAKGFLLDARRLLGNLRSRAGVNDRIAQGEPGGFYRDSQVLPDGTRIEVWTNDGHDTVKITAPPTTPPAPPEPPTVASEPAQPVEKKTAFEPDVPAPAEKVPQTQPTMRSYCINDADAERYTPPLYAESVFGPMIGKKGDVAFMGGWIDGPYTQTNQTHLSEIYAYDTATMAAAGGSYPLPYPPQNGLRMRRDEKTDMFLLFDSRFVGPAVEWGVVSFGEGTQPVRVAMPSDMAYPSRLAASYADFGPTCINGFLPFRRSVQGAAGVWTVDTASMEGGWTGPTGGDEADGKLWHLAATVSGDVLAVRFGVVSGLITEIARYGLASGNTRTYPLPPATDSYDDTEIVSENDDETLWMLQTTGFMAGGQRQQVLSRFDPIKQAWEVVTVDGGLGVRDVSDAAGSWWDFGDGLQHDPITDAVAVIMADGSGAWIFNAADCMDVPLGPFFYPFSQRPDAGAYPSVRGQQFYDGQLLVRYDSVPEQVPSDSNTSVYKHYGIGAIYTIGLLQQTRVDEYAGEEPA